MVGTKVPEAGVVVAVILEVEVSEATHAAGADLLAVAADLSAEDAAVVPREAVVATRHRNVASSQTNIKVA